MARSPGTRARLALPFSGLAGLLLVLLLAGGASRADAAGQVVVRAAAWLILTAAALLGNRGQGVIARIREVRPLVLLLASAELLALLHLVPLPPGWWLALPGRGALADAASASGQPQPWRPLSIVPGATVNAAASLVVPAVVLMLAAALSRTERRLLPGIVTGVVAASGLVGLLQFSGSDFRNPLVNDVPGDVSGLFANRNHFALLMAIGCLTAPAWAFGGGRRAGWRAPVALAAVLVFALLILASGSRAGMIVGVLAIAISLLIVRRGVRQELASRSRWAFPALVAGVVAAVGTAVLGSVAAGRAVSISRAFAIDPGQDMRAQDLPAVFAAVRGYWPAGSGLGGFDPVFRLHEPFELLRGTYFNHAHDDFVEIVLDAGAPGLLLLLAGIGWWAWASLRAWRKGGGSEAVLPRLGSSVLLLILVASAFDYPARTPLVMALATIAGVWLCDPAATARPSALPGRGGHL